PTFAGIPSRESPDRSAPTPTRIRSQSECPRLGLSASEFGFGCFVFTRNPIPDTRNPMPRSRCRRPALRDGIGLELSGTGGRQVNRVIRPRGLGGAPAPDQRTKRRRTRSQTAAPKDELKPTELSLAVGHPRTRPQ